MGAVRVLLVDDSVSFLHSATRFLSIEPWLIVVAHARSGTEAIDMAEAFQPDVVLMDLAMPGMSGLEATRRIKALPRAPKVVLISTYDSAGHREAAMEAGADGYLGKTEFVGRVLPLLSTLRL